MAYFAPYIDGSGIHMPTYEERLEDLVTGYRNIFFQVGKHVFIYRRGDAVQVHGPEDPVHDLFIMGDPVRTDGVFLVKMLVQGRAVVRPCCFLLTYGLSFDNILSDVICTWKYIMVSNDEGYITFVNIINTSDYLQIPYIVKQKIHNSGNLYYTQFINSIYISGEDKPSTPTPKPTVTPASTPSPSPTPTASPTPEPEYDRSIEITCDKADLRIGDKVKLKAKVIRKNDSAPEKTELEWDIAVKSAGTISQDGTLTCLTGARTTVYCRAKDNPNIVGKLIIDIKKPAITSIQPRYFRIKQKKTGMRNRFGG